MGEKDGKDAVIRNRIFVIHDLLVKKCRGKNETSCNHVGKLWFCHNIKVCFGIK